MIDIVFKHQDFWVIYKPEGMNFHSEGEEAGVIAQLQHENQANEIYPVHRLDKMTSGLLIVALNKKATQEFNRLFSERLMQKFYLAISNKKPKKKQGWVKGDMQAARNGSWKLTKTMNNPAITQFVCKPLQPNERLFLLKPHTGKTHQLRVMMKSIGAAICGDQRYALKVEASQEERGYLHAYALKFKWHDEEVEIICPPKAGARFTQDISQLQLQQWQRPWDCF